MKKAQWMSLFIIFLMASSTIGFIGITSNSEEPQTGKSIKYNGQKFSSTLDNRWVTIIDGVQFIFDYSPEELNDLAVPELNFGNKVYIIFDHNKTNSYLNYNVQKLSYTLQATNRAVINVCDKEEGCPENAPIKDCTEDVVYLKITEENKVYNEGKCIVVEGDNEGITKSIDKIDIKLVGL